LPWLADESEAFAPAFEASEEVEPRPMRPALVVATVRAPVTRFWRAACMSWRRSRTAGVCSFVRGGRFRATDAAPRYALRCSAIWRARSARSACRSRIDCSLPVVVVVALWVRRPARVERTSFGVAMSLPAGLERRTGLRSRAAPWPNMLRSVVETAIPALTSRPPRAVAAVSRKIELSSGSADRGSFPEGPTMARPIATTPTTPIAIQPIRIVAALP